MQPVLSPTVLYFPSLFSSFFQSFLFFIVGKIPKNLDKKNVFQQFLRVFFNLRVKPGDCFFYCFSISLPIKTVLIPCFPFLFFLVQQLGKMLHNLSKNISFFLCFLFLIQSHKSWCFFWLVGVLTNFLCHPTPGQSSIILIQMNAVFVLLCKCFQIHWFCGMQNYLVYIHGKLSDFHLAKQFNY